MGLGKHLSFHNKDLGSANTLIGTQLYAKKVLLGIAFAKTVAYEHVLSAPIIFDMSRIFSFIHNLLPLTMKNIQTRMDLRYRPTTWFSDTALLHVWCPRVWVNGVPLR